MQPFALANIHQRFLQVPQIVFGKVMLVSSLAVDWPFGVGLRLYIEFAQAVDYDVGMDVACSVIAICMGADQSLMPRKISFCVCRTSAVDRRFQVLPKPDKSEPPRSGGTGREHHSL